MKRCIQWFVLLFVVALFCLTFWPFIICVILLVGGVLILGMLVSWAWWGVNSDIH